MPSFFWPHVIIWWSCHYGSLTKPRMHMGCWKLLICFHSNPISLMWHIINEGPPNSWNQYIPNQVSKVVLIMGRDLRCRKSRPPRPQVVLVFPRLISDTNLRRCSSHLAVFWFKPNLHGGTQLTWWSNHIESTFSHQSKQIVISPCDYIL